MWRLPRFRSCSTQEGRSLKSSTFHLVVPQAISVCKHVDLCRSERIQLRECDPVVMWIFHCLGSSCSMTMCRCTIVKSYVGLAVNKMNSGKWTRTHDCQCISLRDSVFTNIDSISNQRTTKDCERALSFHFESALEEAFHENQRAQRSQEAQIVVIRVSSLQ